MAVITSCEDNESHNLIEGNTYQSLLLYTANLVLNLKDIT
jgi:hypothetical protein